MALDFLKQPEERRFYFFEAAALAVGLMWMQLALMTNQYLIGFLGLAVLYRRFHRKKED